MFSNYDKQVSDCLKIVDFWHKRIKNGLKFKVTVFFSDSK